MKKWWLCIMLSFSLMAASAQQYILYFKHKAPNSFSLANPSAYLSARAVDRRQRHGIPTDSSDLPVSEVLLDQLRQIPGVQVLNVSRWLNAASVQVTGTAVLQQINTLPFIQKQQQVTSSMLPRNKHQKLQLGIASIDSVWGTEDYRINYGLAEPQVQLHKGQFLHNLGLRGEGMHLGMLDAGFYNYHILPAFDSARAAGRIRETWDFVAREASVTEDHPHGMQCFSIIAANIPGQLVGAAPQATFYLYRSENAATETPVEEFNWICAAERLDSAGGDIISSSLGYNQFDNAAFNHTYRDLDGNTTLVTRGADIAAQKGILVVNAAGNSGNDAWKYLNAPADADSILAVGAVNRNGQPGSFTSYGPSFDGRIKPDVASVGVGSYFQGTNGSIGAGNGTSYAAPNMAGLAACLWQGFPEVRNMEIIDALRQAGSKAQAPDDRVGYGIPDMRKATGILLKRHANASVQLQGCRTTISWQTKDMSAMRYEIERMDPGASSFTKIGELNGTGAVWGNRTYQFTDDLNGFEHGNVHYRILQVLDTAASTPYAIYLDTVSASINVSCALAGRFTIMPSPVAGPATLQLKFEEAVNQLNLVIRNSIGQQVQRLRMSKAAGTQNIPFQTAALAAGKYYLQVFDGEKLLVTLEFLKL